MSAVYQEGPLRNWEAVSFPSSKVYVDVESPSDAIRNCFFRPKKEDMSIDMSFDPTKFQAILTGVTSGASVDFRNIPVTASASVAFGTPPSCDYVPTNIYYYPSGSAVGVGDEPVIGGSITQAPAAIIYSYGSSTLANTGPPDFIDFCALDFNAPALPGFIDGEEVTLSGGS